MNRLEKFLACKHDNVQSFTECCLDCGENIYTTKEQIVKEEWKKNGLPLVVDGVLTYETWYRPGGGQMINRDYLDHDHPEQTYNYLKRHGIKPEDFNIIHPLVQIMQNDFVGKTRIELITEIVALRAELESISRLLA